ncbi:septal ring lytic transglycosylase RlpA family protein [uncultured Roseibium sp.]|uniref:septal ring lytic transglycosylase RlpA family protein n=1 Tax=uncultured Roseibium sp. TaxID=1936171 RepID=UPI00374A2BB5
MVLPKEDPNYKKVGLASWYGPTFHGRKTANGEIFDRNALTAAHTTMPLPSYAKVTNMSNGRSMIVRVNDRGPFHGNRVIDLSERVATMLDTKSHGVAKVKVEYVGRARMDGHDESFLMASYSGPGAVTPGGTVPGTLMAQATPPAPVFGRAPAPAPRPYGGSVLLASASHTGSTYQVAYDPALAFESSQSTIAVASLNTFSQSNAPQAAPVAATAYSPQPAAYAEPAPAGAASGTLGVLRVPAAGTPRNLLSGSAVSSYSANNRINAAYDAVSGMAAGSVPSSRLARNGN